MACEKTLIIDPLEARRRFIRSIYNKFAKDRAYWVQRNSYYYDRLRRLLRSIVEPKSRVLQIRCDIGNLLDAVEPSRGVGIDFSTDAIALAQSTYPHLDFKIGDPEFLDLNEKFDYVLLVNAAVSESADVLKVFQELKKVATPKTRVVIINWNYLWQPLVRLAEVFKIKMKQPPQNWLSLADIENLLNLAGYEVVKKYRTLLFPKYVPVLSFVLNKMLAHLPGLNRLCFVQTLIAKEIVANKSYQDLSCSVIIPCKNEKGNIQGAVERIPTMGKNTEILFVDDRSTDGTGDMVRQMIARYPGKDIKLVQGPGICKALAVWEGFDAASGDVLMILDGDLTTIPEELPHFFNAMAEGKGEFINGSRLIYPMEKEAMRTFNILGNKFFSLVFTYLLDQRIKDTLCGTKVLFKEDYQRIKKLRGMWGINDQWGDYELLFGASKLNLKIIDLPVHYFERTYGETKMRRRFANGWLMLRMCLVALKKLKLIC